MSTNLKSLASLREQRQKLTSTMKRLADGADKDGRAMTELELNEFERARTERTRADADIDDAIGAQEHERTKAAAALGIGTTADRNGSTPTRGRRYADLFGREAASDQGGFDSFADFLKTIASGLADPRLARASSGITDSDGGFLIPPGWSRELVDATMEASVILPRARVRPMLSRDMQFPLWNNLDHTGKTVYGGFTAAWVAEGSTGTVQTPKLREIKLSAKKLMILGLSSNELLEDSTGFAEDFRQALIGAATWFIDDALVNGSGAGVPLGVLNDAAKITQAKETGQLGSTIVTENVYNMLSRLHPASEANAVWLAHPATRAQLLGLHQSVGTGGMPFLIPAGGGTERVKWLLLGYPIYFTEKCSNIGTEGDLVLCDLSQYLVGLRRELTVDVSKHAGFTSDQTYFRISARLDAQGIWSDPFTPQTGATLSWIVSLATRS